MGDDKPLWKIPRPGQLTWLPIEPIGKFTAASALASLPMSILAGFSFGGAVTILVVDRPGVALALAAVALATAGVLLLVGLHHSISADTYQPNPTNRLAWFPEATTDSHALDEMRVRQREDLFRYTYYRDKSATYYFTGLTVVVLGVAAALLAPVEGWGECCTSRTEDWLVEVSLFAGVVVLVVFAVRLLTFAPAISRLLPAVSKRPKAPQPESPKGSNQRETVEAKRRRVSLAEGHRRSIYRGVELDVLLTVEPVAVGGDATVGPAPFVVRCAKAEGEAVTTLGGDGWAMSCDVIVERTLTAAHQGIGHTPFVVDIDGERFPVATRLATGHTGASCVFELVVSGVDDFAWTTLPPLP